MTTQPDAKFNRYQLVWDTRSRGLYRVEDRRFDPNSRNWYYSLVNRVEDRAEQDVMEMNIVPSTFGLARNLIRAVAGNPDIPPRPRKFYGRRTTAMPYRRPTNGGNDAA